MLEFLDEKVFTTTTVGTIIGLYIVYLLAKYVYIGCLVILSFIEESTLVTFKNTKYQEPLSLFFRKTGNLVTRLKWSDPKKDLWKDFDSTVDQMYNEMKERQRKSAI